MAIHQAQIKSCFFFIFSFGEKKLAPPQSTTSVVSPWFASGADHHTSQTQQQPHEKGKARREREITKQEIVRL